MIILFIIVGLIYDWGGVKGHPGPVSDWQLRQGVLMTERVSGAFKLPKWSSVHWRICQLCTNICVCVLLFWRNGARRRSRR